MRAWSCCCKHSGKFVRQNYKSVGTIKAYLEFISNSVNRFGTLNREATDENLYDDREDSSGKGGKRPAMKGHLEEANKLQCSTTT